MEDDPNTDVYSGVIKKLQDGGVFSLADIELLKYHELNNLFDEIKHWSVYGNKDSEKLRSAIKTLSTQY